MSTSIKSPLFILGAAPSNKVEIPNFFQEDSSFYKLLEKPPYLRYMGWNLLTLDHPKIVDGQCWEVRNGDRKTIRLYRDGSFVAVAYADNTFLGWGQSEEDFLKHPRLNTLAIIEYVYEFVELYKNLLQNIPMSKEIRMDVSIKNSKVNEQFLFLIPQKIDNPFYFAAFDGGTISGDFTATVVIQRNGETQYETKYVAYKILSEVFTRFGIAADKIPYTDVDDQGMRFIDTKQFPRS
jgi:hypothetical protein